MLTPTQRLELEAMIDKDDLSSVLQEIATICSGKAEHLAENWQDERSAKIWENAATVVERASDAPSVRHASGYGAGVDLSRSQRRN